MSCYFLNIHFIKVISLYLVITISYTLLIKKIPVLEIFWLALGFLIRALAGSVVIGQAPTGWFIFTIYFGALFLTSCKRRSEMMNESKANARKVLSEYTLQFLDSISTMFAGVTAITYALWVIQEHHSSYVAYLSIVPFYCTLVYYLLMSVRGETEEPEIYLVTNRIVRILGLVTVMMLVSVFYL